MKKLIFVISFIVLYSFLFGFSATDAKSVTTAELETQLVEIRAQITKLQELLTEISSPQVLGEEISTPTEIISRTQINTEKGLSESGEANFSGYIVQFKEEPLLVKKSELQKKVKEKKITVLEMQSQFYLYKNKLESSFQLSKNQLQRIVPNFKAKIKNEFKDAFHGIALDISGTEVEKVKKLSFVEEVYPNYEVQALLMDSVPLIGADDVWDLGYTGTGMTIAIIDTGIDYTHPDLGGCLGPTCKVIGGFDFVNNTTTPMDDNGHGTHCAGIAAGNGALRGVAPDAKLLSYKVLDSRGTGYPDQIIAGIERSVDPNQDGDYSDRADVISISLGGPGNPDDPMSQAVDNAVDSGVVAVIAAGNSGPTSETILSPGVAREAITVGATYKKDYGTLEWRPCTDYDAQKGNVACFSSRGPVVWGNGAIIKPDVIAPGAIIRSAQWNDEYTESSGTSMAAPHVAGAAVLIRQAHPDWTPEEIKMSLRAAVTSYDSDTADFSYGFGLVDVEQSIQMEKPPIANIEPTFFPNGIVNKDIIAIEGTATGENFNQYSLYYGKYEGDELPINWNKIKTAFQQVENNILGTLDTSNFDRNSLYLLRLVVQGNGVTVEDKLPIVIPFFPLTDGWPFGTQELYSGGNGPTIADINQDGIKEIILVRTILFNSDPGTKLHVLKPDGTSLPGFPITLGVYLDTTPPAVGDIDGDGTLEIVVMGSEGVSGGLEIFVIRSDGTYFENWPKILNYTEQFKVNDIPVLGDIDNDGDLEIIAVTKQPATIHVLHHTGDYVDGWPINLGESYVGVSPVAFADIDNDAKPEILAVADKKISEFTTDKGIHMIESRSVIHAWNIDGSNAAGWPVELEEVILHDRFIHSFPPIVGDVDNDNNLEIIVATACSYNCYDASINILKNDGTIINKWSANDKGYIISHPIIGDVDGDGDLEIVLAFGKIKNSLTRAEEGGYIYVWHHDGSIVDGWPITIPETSVGTTYSSWKPPEPVLVDIDNDGDIEIIFGYDGKILLAWHHNGTGLFGSWLDYYQFTDSIITDLDNDGDIEIVAGPAYFMASQNILLLPHYYVLDGESPLSESGWSMFRHDPQHTGSHTTAVTTTCADSDGGNNYYAKGITKRCEKGEILSECQEFTDVCADSTTLKEYYCEDGAIKSIDYNCPYGCKDGACMEAFITIISPNGEEQWVTGETYNITWTSQGMDYPNMWLGIYLLKENDELAKIIALGVPLSAGEYSWTIPSDITPGSKYKIRLYAQGIVDASDNYFSIIPASCIYLSDGVQSHYGAVCGDANYDPVFDLDKDGSIGMSDFGLISANIDNESWCNEMKESTENPCETCTDSDGGKNYYVKGTVESGSDAKTDWCGDWNGDGIDEKVVEYFCDSTVAQGWGDEQYLCPSGQCKDGACIKATTHTLFVSKTGTGSGTVTSDPTGINCGTTCSASYGHNISVTLTVTPNDDSTFVGWSGSCSGTEPCIVSMTSDQSVTATFDKGIVEGCTAYNGYIYCRSFASTDPQDSSCQTACSARGYTCPAGDNMLRSESQIIEVATELGLLAPGEPYSSKAHKNYQSSYIMEQLSTGAKYLFYNQKWSQSCTYVPRTHKFYESINICRCEEIVATQDLEQIEDQIASMRDVLSKLIEQVRNLIRR